MAGIQCCSNHPLVLSDEQQTDTGVKRRLCYVKMRASLLNSGKDVKALINRGALNPELLWLAQKFYEYLEKMPHSTRLHPIPPILHLFPRGVIKCRRFSRDGHITLVEAIYSQQEFAAVSLQRV
jgi:hypothetical protein